MSIALGNVGVRRLVWTLAALIVALFVGGCSAGSNSEDVDSVTGALCSGLQLTASPASPQTQGTQVTITANGATCGAGETPEYIFYSYNPSGTYTLFRNWGTSNTAVWNTTNLPSGSYNILVFTRPVGGTTTTSKFLDSPYLIGNVCTTVTSLNASPPSPQPSGTTLSLSATATCSGNGVPEFRYGYYADNGSLVYINANYTTSAVPWDTTGLSGNRTLVVFARAVGATGNTSFDGSRYASYTLGTASTTCSTVGLSTSPAAPSPPGTMITLTGSASPCASPQFIYYYRLYGTTTWKLLRDFASGSAVWDTSSLGSGTYELLVGARNSTNTGAADAYAQKSYAIGSVCGSVTASASPVSPQPQGLTVMLSAAASCGSATAEYQFYYEGGATTARTLLRDWGAATFNWDTSTVGPAQYLITVFARAVGNSSAYEALTQFGYTLTTPTIAQISTGFGYHTCSRLNNSRVKCSGQNTSGQLGNGTTTNSSTGVLVSGLTNVVAVTTGNTHSCAVLSDQTVRCWGDGSLGQLGNGGTTSSSIPVTVTGLNDATAISAGMNHTCALRTGGAVSCWGYNGNGQLGNSSSYPQSTTPLVVTAVSGATAIAVGGFHSCALIGGAVSCWGDGHLGQMGNGATSNLNYTPVAVTGLSGVTSLSSGEQSSCAVISGGVKCWGDNTYGQIGDGTKTQANTPVSVAGLSTAVQVSAGFPMSCARLSGGTVNCWGYNNEGELGNGGSAESLTPVVVSNITSATSLSTGGLQSCALVSTGNALCWGYNGFGQLGNGTTTDAHAPVTVQ